MIAWAQRRGLPSSIALVKEIQTIIHFFLIRMKFKLQKSANFLHTKYLTHKLMCFVICIPLREHVSCLCLPTVWSTSPGLLVWPPPFSSPPTSGPLSEQGRVSEFEISGNRQKSHVLKNCSKLKFQHVVCEVIVGVGVWVEVGDVASSEQSGRTELGHFHHLPARSHKRVVTEAGLLLKRLGNIVNQKFENNV